MVESRRVSGRGGAGRRTGGGWWTRQRQCHKQAIKRHKKLGWRNNNSATEHDARSSDYHVINMKKPPPPAPSHWKPPADDPRADDRPHPPPIGRGRISNVHGKDLVEKAWASVSFFPFWLLLPPRFRFIMFIAAFCGFSPLRAIYKCHK